MDLDRTLAGAHILREYQDAGRGFDGIEQMLMPHLREHRRAEPRAEDYGLEPVVPGRFRPHLVVDASVLLSYARLDNPTVGAALVEAVADPECRVIVSPLSYLEALPGAGDRLHRLLEAVSSPPVGARQLEAAARLRGPFSDQSLILDPEESLAVRHTVLLALLDRCVIGTLDPAPYHRLGYRRTLDLSA